MSRNWIDPKTGQEIEGVGRPTKEQLEERTAMQRELTEQIKQHASEIAELLVKTALRDDRRGDRIRLAMLQHFIPSVNKPTAEKKPSTPLTIQIVQFGQRNANGEYKTVEVKAQPVADAEIVQEPKQIEVHTVSFANTQPDKS